MQVLQIFTLLIMLLLGGCSGISIISGQSSEDLYTKQFLVSIGKIKGRYGTGDKKGALEKLKLLNEEGLLPSEKALRRNLIGVIKFSTGEYEQAIFNFDIALATSGLDEALTSQVYMNLASSYYKLQQMEKAYSSLKLIQADSLRDKDKKKYYELKLIISKELGQHRDALLALINIVGFSKSLELIKGSEKFGEMINIFFQLDSGERLRILEDFDNSNLVVVGYLGYLEAEKRYYLGQKNESRQILEWVTEKFGSDKSIGALIKGFSYRIANYAKMDQKAIGIILPLSGRKKKFGQRALMGIDTGFRERLMKSGYSIEVKDSKGSGVVGALRVKELIERKYVSVIIGGLFSATAEKEYLEARKYGVLFISLSPIHLPKGRKDHLLIEVPGSIESQINTILSDDVLPSLGNRVAILYSDDSTGEAYVSEFWRVAREQGIEISGAISYSSKQHDFRDQVKNILGLKFKRDRQEELELLSEINNLKEKGAIRRIQNLKPNIDFDWVFVQSNPQVALQLLPSFRYFDAFNLKFVGTPRWRSQKLAKNSSKLGKLYFVGEDIEKAQESLNSSFKKMHKTTARLIEMYSYDAIKMTDSFLIGQDFSSRDELDGIIKGRLKIDGITGDWEQREGIWIKDMSLLELKRGRIERFL